MIIMSRKALAACVTNPSLYSMLTVILVCNLADGVIAHDGPEAVIASLNASMLKSGPTADLLFRRATEFRAIRDDRRAAADLHHAVQLDGSLEIARLDLARLQLHLEKAAADSERSNSSLGEPLETIEPLITSQNETIQTAALGLRGEIYFSYCQWEAAVADLSSALEKRPAEIQWALWLATAQRERGQQMTGISGLRQCFVVTQSPVIRAALCDALIEAARLDRDSSGHLTTSCLSEADEIIAQELQESRLKSAWLIRRAETLLLRSDVDAARLDLAIALDELNVRLATARPDPGLLTDRERVQRLLR